VLEERKAGPLQWAAERRKGRPVGCWCNISSAPAACRAHIGPFLTARCAPIPDPGDTLGSMVRVLAPLGAPRASASPVALLLRGVSRRLPAGMRLSRPVPVPRGGVAERVVVYFPVYDVYQVCHAAVVHVPYALVEPGVYVPLVLWPLPILAPVRRTPLAAKAPLTQPTSLVRLARTRYEGDEAQEKGREITPDPRRHSFHKLRRVRSSRWPLSCGLSARLGSRDSCWPSRTHEPS
jgi:hypothetical protein